MKPLWALNFFGRRRAYDKLALAETLEIDAATISRILETNSSAHDRSLAMANARERAAQLEQILGMLEAVYGDLDYAVAWLKTPSVLWSEEGDLSAIDLMAKEAWGMEAVYQTVDSLYRGEPDT